MEATLSSKNQATIPKAVREYLHLKPGDRFRFFFQPDGAVGSPHRRSKAVFQNLPGRFQS
jgi:AbrB family looped-hinge helix DNA binding protein